MSTDAANDLMSFYDFLGHRLRDGTYENTPEECLAEFRAYETERKILEARFREAEEESRAGKSHPMDAEAIKRNVRERLAEHGITD
jgi:hypothetical protein